MYRYELGTVWWQKELLSRNALRQLASRLQGMDYYTVPDFLMPINTTFSFAGQVPTLAGIANPTKLHLAFCNSPEPPDFQPLAQLTCLQDLVLQCLGNSAAAECSQVIDSNSSSLKHLILESTSWTDNTYAAVGRVATLKAAVFKVAVLSDSSTALVSSLVHPRLVEVWIPSCRQMTLEAFCAISSGSAKTTYLYLSGISSAQCQQLQSLPSLQYMVIFSPMLTAGDIFHHQQPELTSLLWHNCLRLSHDQIQNLVAKFPVLEYLLFYYEAQTPPLADTVISDTAGLATLTLASKLRAASLQEVSDEMLNIFETHFVLKQKFGNAGRAQKEQALFMPDCGGGRPFRVWLTYVYPTAARCEKSVPRHRIMASKCGHIAHSTVKPLATAMSIVFTIAHARLLRQRRRGLVWAWHAVCMT